MPRFARPAVLRLLAALSVLLVTGAPRASGGALAAAPTGAGPAARPRIPAADVPAVQLGDALDLALLAGAGVVNGGMTTVAGDIAVSPGTTVDGFPPGQVRGMVNRDDAEARREKAAAMRAYKDAAGRSPTAVIAPQLGGTTIPPGVFATPGRVFQISGTLTLDALGDPDAGFVFQADTLITDRVSNINLVNGAQPDNVVWQLRSTADLGRYSTFRGNVMALSNVTVRSGTALYGRAMALDDKVVTEGTDRRPTTRATQPDNPPTETTLTSSANPSHRNQPVTFTATVTGDFRGFNPTNKVLFRDGDLVIGSAMLDPSGHASFTTSGLSVGTHPITAVYVNGGTAYNEGWVDFAPSQSPVLNQVVLN
ncbi:hypothetical protein GCM10009677_28620 [Sphaerisporangium rubeum]|uniref:Bacterial Ig-like domain-containing protein n=1 Tax=Sphaerisporangium rubeum TaxID=321317 RepID=A0A7X0M7L4_9ACTN|nr:ice-binding family protein [Sphaerisporangium rubeum]MBB6472971.1 hypothetical protein [Sphaerisporangium rubeum]